MRVAHILYSGLGGHGREFFSLVEADPAREMNTCAVFFGVEAMRREYHSECARLGVAYTYVAKAPGEHAAPLRNVYRALRRFAPDIVVLHGGVTLPAVLAYSLSHRTTIVVMETEPNELKRRSYHLQTLLGLLLADSIVCLTEPYRDQLRSVFAKVFDERRVHVIPNGINVAKTFVPPPRSRPARADTIRLGMQSRINEKKDHKTLLKAFAISTKRAEMPPMHLTIAGDGDTRPMVEQMTRDLDLADSVSLEGMLDTHDLVSWLQNIDIYVQATHGESFCFSVMEALAVGLPVITSRVPVLDQTMAHNPAVSFYPAQDAEALADCICELINQSSRRQDIARAAREYAERELSATVMKERYFALFRDAPPVHPLRRISTLTTQVVARAFSRFAQMRS